MAVWKNGVAQPRKFTREQEEERRAKWMEEYGNDFLEKIKRETAQRKAAGARVSQPVQSEPSPSSGREATVILDRAQPPIDYDTPLPAEPTLVEPVDHGFQGSQQGNMLADMDTSYLFGYTPQETPIQTPVTAKVVAQDEEDEDEDPSHTYQPVDWAKLYAEVASREIDIHNGLYDDDEPTTPVKRKKEEQEMTEREHSRIPTFIKQATRTAYLEPKESVVAGQSVPVQPVPASTPNHKPVAPSTPPHAPTPIGVIHKSDHDNDYRRLLRDTGMFRDIAQHPIVSVLMGAEGSKQVTIPATHGIMKESDLVRSSLLRGASVLTEDSLQPPALAIKQQISIVEAYEQQPLHNPTQSQLVEKLTNMRVYMTGVAEGHTNSIRDIVATRKMPVTFTPFIIPKTESQAAVYQAMVRHYLWNASAFRLKAVSETTPELRDVWVGARSSYENLFSTTFVTRYWAEAMLGKAIKDKGVQIGYMNFTGEDLGITVGNTGEVTYIPTICGESTSNMRVGATFNQVYNATSDRPICVMRGSLMGGSSPLVGSSTKLDGLYVVIVNPLEVPRQLSLEGMDDVCRWVENNDFFGISVYQIDRHSLVDYTRKKVYAGAVKLPVVGDSLISPITVSKLVDECRLPVNALVQHGGRTARIWSTRHSAPEEVPINFDIGVSADGVYEHTPAGWVMVAQSSQYSDLTYMRRQHLFLSKAEADEECKRLGELNTLHKPKFQREEEIHREKIEELRAVRDEERKAREQQDKIRAEERQYTVVSRLITSGIAVLGIAAKIFAPAAMQPLVLAALGVVAIVAVWPWVKTAVTWMVTTPRTTEDYP